MVMEVRDYRIVAVDKTGHDWGYIDHKDVRYCCWRNSVGEVFILGDVDEYLVRDWKPKIEKIGVGFLKIMADSNYSTYSLVKISMQIDEFNGWLIEQDRLRKGKHYASW